MTSNLTSQSQDYQYEPQSKSKYNKTTMIKKTQLIDLVINCHYSIYKASKKLKLSNSTAKSIIQNYQKYGIVLQKFTKNRLKRLTLEIKDGKRQENEKICVKAEQNMLQIMIKQQQIQKGKEEIGDVIVDNEIYPYFRYNYPYLIQYRLQ